MTRSIPTGSIRNATIDSYYTGLREPHRPPSRGGNTRALHAHYLVVAGETYSFLALGSRRWVFKRDRVSFDFEVKGAYKNIDAGTIRTVDGKGRVVVRGYRGFKPKLRTAQTRLPVSRREARD